MTHEELLKHLWEKRNSLCDHLDVHFALSAVVELHQPTPDERYIDFLCQGCSMTEINLYVNYPCPTIQVIEKAL
jgi:hypothetical protein